MAFETPFNLAELNTALKRLKNNKVPGTDNIKNELLQDKEVHIALLQKTILPKKNRNHHPRIH